MRPLHRPGGVDASHSVLFLLLVVLFLPILSSTSVGAAEKGPMQDSSKTLVLDGSYVHDVGMLHMNITNFGLLGSEPGGAGPGRG